MLGHSVRYPPDFVVGLEDVIVNLKFLSAIVPVKQNTTAGLGGKQEVNSIISYYLPGPGLTNEMITGANTSAGWVGGCSRGMSPQ